MRTLFTFILAFAAFSGAVAQPSGFSPGSDHAALRLLGTSLADIDTDAITLPRSESSSLLAGIHIELEEDWHTYWQNPGDSGIPLDISWELPDGFEAGKLHWPHPEPFEEGQLITYGYKNESMIFQPLRIYPEAGDGSYELHAQIEFLVCREACLPGFEELSLSVEVQNGQIYPAESGHQELFERFMAGLPVPLEAAGRYEQQGNELILEFPETLRAEAARFLGDEASGQDNLYFYAAEENITEASAPQQFTFRDGRLVGTTQVSRYRNEALSDEFSGVLVMKEADNVSAIELLFRQ